MERSQLVSDNRKLKKQLHSGIIFSKVERRRRNKVEVWHRVLITWRGLVFVFASLHLQPGAGPDWDVAVSPGSSSVSGGSLIPLAEFGEKSLSENWYELRPPLHEEAIVELGNFPLVNFLFCRRVGEEIDWMDINDLLIAAMKKKHPKSSMFTQNFCIQ